MEDRRAGPSERPEAAAALQNTKREGITRYEKLLIHVNDLGLWFDGLDRDILYAAVETVLAILGDDKLTDDESKKEEVLSLLGKMPTDSEYSMLVSLANQLYTVLNYMERAREAGRSALEEKMSVHPRKAEVSTALSEIKTYYNRMLPEAEEAFVRVRDRPQPNRGVGSRKLLDFFNLYFIQGSHFMSSGNHWQLPDESFTNPNKGYNEVFVPALQHRPMADSKVVVFDKDGNSIQFDQAAYDHYNCLDCRHNRLTPAAFESNQNLLLCTPTGAGKTVVALLCMLRVISLHYSKQGTVATDSFKMVYIAPMKSLVQEMVVNCSKFLKPFGLRVGELTGDHQRNKEQIQGTQLIVCTPEEWDIFTRQSEACVFTQLVRLIIIDEIHLLHDKRGPVLEAIIARTIRQVESTQQAARLVGLSASLPNYQDVATFLKVDPAQGLFFFDNSFRPIPLEQTFIGFTEKDAMKRFQLMNNVLCDKVEERVGKGHVLVFVHSDKEAVKTAKMIRDMCVENETIKREDSTSTGQVENEDLRDLLPYGFGVHHAGLTKEDRTMVKELFFNRSIKVLFSTATLAWGVNLPAHTVIIKGTQIYSPEQGCWVELGALNVLQMLGRSSHLQYYSAEENTKENAETILMASHAELEFYQSLLNQQVPIESHLIGKMADNLNAEIVLGNVQNVEDAVNWLGCTYMYQRMLQNPTLYGISEVDAMADPKLRLRRADLVHSAASILNDWKMIDYDHESGSFQMTELGRIASHCYCTSESMVGYNHRLKEHIDEFDLVRVFCRSSEFRFIVVRSEEKLELAELQDQFPIKEGREEPSAKVNVLLQAFISGLKPKGFTLASDMAYVGQIAGRLMRAIFELCLYRGWVQPTIITLTLCKMVERRTWSMKLLNRFKNLPDDVMQKFEQEKLKVPKLKLSVHVQQLTRSTLQVELTIVPDFPWDDKVHENSQAFWVFVEDVNSEVILHSEYFLLKKKYCEEKHFLNFFVLVKPESPQYSIRAVSDKWLDCETQHTVSLSLPEKFPQPTELDLQPLPVTVPKEPNFEALFRKDLHYFNPIQTQVFDSLYNSDDNVFVGAPTGSGKSVCAEFAILRLLQNNQRGRCVYVAPNKARVDQMYSKWSERFGRRLGLNVVQLTGETAADLKLLEKAFIVMATPEQWDMLSRRWKERQNVQNVHLFIVDELHRIGGEFGPVLEAVCSRMRYISSEIDRSIRIVALSSPVANAKDLGQWLGATRDYQFNFRPSARPASPDVSVQGFSSRHAPSRLLAMDKPLYDAIIKHSPRKPVMVYVPSRHQTQRTALKLLQLEVLSRGQQIPDDHTHSSTRLYYPTNITFCKEKEKVKNRFLLCSTEEIAQYIPRITEKTLSEVVTQGVGYLHEGLSEEERLVVEGLFNNGYIQVLVVSRSLVWAMHSKAHLVVVMDTQSYDDQTDLYVEYPLTDVLQMLGQAKGTSDQDKCVRVVMCQNFRKDFYLNVLSDPLPVESRLQCSLHDHVNAEIVAGTITSRKNAVNYLTRTFLHCRMSQNPNHYKLQGMTQDDRLSALVESTLEELQGSQCITIGNDMPNTLKASNLGIIVSHKYINYTNIGRFSKFLTKKIELGHSDIVEIVSNAAEYRALPMRHLEEGILAQLAQLPGLVDLPLPERCKFTDPHIKANLLLRAHMSRLQLSPELQSDTEDVLKKVTNLLQVCIGVANSKHLLTPALAAMELSQMMTQAVRYQDSVLRQLPYFTAEMIQRCENKGVESVFHFMNMKDEERSALLNHLSDRQRKVVAVFCNRYPAAVLTYDVDNADNIHSGDDVVVEVSLEREDEDEMSRPYVGAPFFPQKRQEGWWLVLGNFELNKLVTIRRLPQAASQPKVSLRFTAPDVGTHKYNLYYKCDAYVGCDQDCSFSLEVKNKEEVQSMDQS